MLDLLIYLADKLETPDKHDFFSYHMSLTQDSFFEALSYYDILFDAHESVQLPIYELIEGIIYHFSLTTCSDAYIQFFLNFTFKFSSSQSCSILDFLQHYDRKKDRLKINSPEGINAVQIMTIHKSKGLEFPIVIFPYADLDIYKEIDPKIWFSLNEDDYCGFSHTLLNYNKDVAEFGEQGLEIDYSHKTELELDSLNLLYVALTRAVEKLFIVSGIYYDSKKNIAIKLRGESQQVRKNRAIDDSDMEHLYYPVKFFEQFAIENNLSFQLIDEDIPDLDFYESASYRFSVLLRNSAVKVN